MEEITHKLKKRQRFVSPIIKNNDTGEVLTLEELDKKVQKGIDPSCLASNPKRVDIGNVICTPFVPFIPRSITPNQITMFNHAVSWCQLLCALYAAHLPYGYTHTILLIIAAVLNFATMMLDCLDGMHARYTKQTSKLGEVLDHFLDSCHVPMITAGITSSLVPEYPMAICLINVLNTIVYHVQLLTYHHERVFLHTSGVEGQIVTSVVYLFLALVPTEFRQTSYFHYIIMTIVIASIFTFIQLSWVFVRRFDWTMWKEELLFLCYLGAVSAMYLLGDLTRLQFLFLVIFISFRITGQYVLYSVAAREPYNGTCRFVVMWICLIAASHYLMYPIQMSMFFAKVPALAQLWGSVTSHEFLPAFACVHLLLLSFSALLENERKLK